MDHLVPVTFWNTVLLAALLMLQPSVRWATLGFAYATSSLDHQKTEPVFARRLAMARSNQIEAMALWGLIVLLAVITDADLTHPHIGWTCSVFLMARVSYVAVALAGIPIARSLTFAVGLGAWMYLTWFVFLALPF